MHSTGGDDISRYDALKPCYCVQVLNKHTWKSIVRLVFLPVIKLQARNPIAAGAASVRHGVPAFSHDR